VQYEAYSPLGGLSGLDILSNPAVEAVAARHNASTATVALRWVVQQEVPFVTSSTKEGYDLEDLGAVGSGAVLLSPSEMAALSAI
jgi:diketogulonate reductase-like aldo/keto reductase